MRLVVRLLVDVVHDGLVNVPPHEVDRGERGHRPARVRTYQAFDDRGPVLFCELGRFVQDLEAHAVSREAGRVEGPDHHATESLGGVGLHELHELRIGLAAGDELGPDDDVRRVEEVQPEEVLPERFASPGGERVDG